MQYTTEARRLIRPALALALLIAAGGAARADESAVQPTETAALSGLGTAVHSAEELDAVRAVGADDEGQVVVPFAEQSLDDLDLQLGLTTGGVRNLAPPDTTNPTKGGLRSVIVPTVTTRARSF